jgi:hypothetical protein
MINKDEYVFKIRKREVQESRKYYSKWLLCDAFGQEFD